MNCTTWIAVDRGIGGSSKAKRATRRFSAILVAVLLGELLLGSPTAARAAAVNATWLGGNGIWNVGANWSPIGAPSNGANTYSVFIDNGKGDNAMVTVNNFPTISNLTVDSGNTLILSDGITLTIAGGAGAGSISDAGTINIGSTGDPTSIALSGANASFTLVGGGVVSMSNNSNNQFFGTGSQTLTNSLNNTIQGSGQVGVGNGSGQQIALINNGTIDANQSVALTVNPGSGVTNTGTLEATGGGTLDLQDAYTNTGATIQAVGTGSTVNLNAIFTPTTINGGTLTTTTGGAINIAANDFAALNGVTISSGSTVTAQDGSSTTLAGTLAIDTGAIFMMNSSSVIPYTSLVLSSSSNTVTLSGGGTLSMSNNNSNRITGSGSNSLMNSLGNTIQGSGQIGIGTGASAFALTNNGTIDANQSVALTINPGNGVTNTGTLEATGGGTLDLQDTYTNTGAIIQATGTNSVVNLNGTNFSQTTINGGTVTNTTGGAINIAANSVVTLNGVTINGGSTVTAQNGAATTLKGTLTIDSDATFAMNVTSGLDDIHVSGEVILAGGGTMSLSNNGNNRVYGSGTDTLTNSFGNTIQGSGQIGIAPSSDFFTLINNGTINANQSVALTVAPGNSITNNSTGVIEATGGGTLDQAMSFTNNGTVKATGGSAYDVISAGKRAFTNANTVIVGPNSTFNAGVLGSGAQNPYVQSAGMTELTDPTSVLEDDYQGININGGTLEGVGTIKAGLHIAGIFEVGDAPGVLAVTGSYSQTAAGALEIAIGGADPGAMGYSQLNISSTAALAGTLDLSLFDDFIPFNGETFTILTSHGLGGTKFSTLDGAAEGNVTFSVSYTSDDVMLTAAVAAPEPSTFVLLAIGLAGVAIFSTRRRKRSLFVHQA